MKLYATLTELLDEARGKDREIRFIDGENDETVIRFSDLWDRALALLGALQARGMRPGDETTRPASDHTLPADEAKAAIR